MEEQAKEGATVPADCEVAKPVSDCSNPDLVFVGYTHGYHDLATTVRHCFLSPADGPDPD